MLARASAVEYYLSQRGLALGYAAPRPAEDSAAKELADKLAANWEEVTKSLRLETPGAREAAADYVASLARLVSGDPRGLRLAHDLMALAQHVPIPVYIGGELYYMYKPTPEEVSRVEAVDYTFLKELLDPYLSFDVERGLVRFGNRVVGKVDEITGARIAAVMSDMSTAGAFLLQAALRQMEAFNRQLPEGATPYVHENLVALNLDRILPQEMREYVDAAYVRLQYATTPYTELFVAYHMRYLGIRDTVTVPLGELDVVTAGADLARSVERGVKTVVSIAETVRRVDQEASRLGVRDIGVRVDETGALVYTERFVPVRSPVLSDPRASDAFAKHVAEKVREYLQTRGVNVEVHGVPAEDGVALVLQAHSRDGSGVVKQVHEARRLVDSAGRIIAEREAERFAMAAGLLYAEARRRGLQLSAPSWVASAAEAAEKRYSGLQAATEKRGGETYILGVPARYVAAAIGLQRLPETRGRSRAEEVSN